MLKSPLTFFFLNKWPNHKITFYLFCHLNLKNCLDLCVINLRANGALFPSHDSDFHKLNFKIEKKLHIRRISFVINVIEISIFETINFLKPCPMFTVPPKSGGAAAPPASDMPGKRYKKFITSLQFANNRIAEGALFAPLLLQRLESAALPSGHETL